MNRVDESIVITALMIQSPSLLEMPPPQVALQQSDYVAYNIWAEKERRRPLDFR